MSEYSNLFPNCYDDSKARFMLSLSVVQARWPNASLSSHRLDDQDDLTIDWIEAEPLEKKDRLVIITTGEHGIEGFVGAAMLQLFLSDFASLLHPETTGLRLVHTINPWGMFNRRRTNHKNVDLNRNFLDSPDLFDEDYNPDYARFVNFINPQGMLNSLAWEKMRFIFRLLQILLSAGPKPLKAASLNGQYRFPTGIYYGGRKPQDETNLMMDLFRDALSQYNQILVLDMHTGYGPRYEMSVVNSWMEPRSSAQCQEEFAYPRVVKTNPAEFYSIKGDMIDYLYTLAQREAPQKHLFATSFEFGTFGDSLLAGLRAMRTMIFENRLYWSGASRRQAASSIMADFLELYFPAEEHWREKAILDARQAFRGILKAEGYL